MTSETVPNSLSVLQPSSVLPAQQFGRRAFGRQRRMSRATVARNIVDSILTHRQLGQDRPITFYTYDPATQDLAQDLLDALVMTADEAVATMAGNQGSGD